MNSHLRHVLLGWILLSVLAPLASAHEGHEEEGYTDAKAARATPVPDRVILTWTGDPATTQAATWRTDTSAPEAKGQIAVAEDGPLFAAKAIDVPATTQLLQTDIGECHCHTVEFTGLTPKTKYVYRVGDGAHWSEWFHFTTASTEAEPFSFVYFGDAQNDLKSMWSRVFREAYSDAPKASFIIHAGDLINNANRDVEWQEWFYAAGWVNGMVPTIPTPGNHEYFKDPTNEEKRLVSNNWRPQFALPKHGPAGLEETVYWIDYQGVRIVSLNSNERIDEQAAWLAGVLSQNPNKWTILTYHHPMYSGAKDRDNPQLRAIWQPVFDKYGVDLVLQGHDHTYARTGQQKSENVPTGVNVFDDNGGTAYVVSVSGPKMYANGKLPEMKRVAEDTQLYQIIHVDGDTIRYEARTARGDLYDAFKLVKHADGKNELIEEVPDHPENLRGPAPVVGE
jgi:3',5'-cyclic AMP phosphodiesterase CpdA